LFAKVFSAIRMKIAAMHPQPSSTNIRIVDLRKML
jgi:hypothetical protein